MNEDRQWFAAKRYGYGSGMPISWQGWVLTVGYLALVLVVVRLCRNDPVQLIAILAPITIAFILICARTTRGGWRWRWGEDD